LCLGTKKIFFYLFIASQLYFFISTFIEYKFGNEHRVVISLVGSGVAVSKGAAAVLNFDCGVILFPVCRTIISTFRVTFLNKIIPLDKNITFHRHVGYGIVLFTYIHCTAHYWNFHMLGVATTHSGGSLIF
jgi:NADPH oxidase